MDEINSEKISTAESSFMIIFALFSDLVEFLISLTGIGIIMGVAINFITGTMIGFWLNMRMGGLAKGVWKKMLTYGVGVFADGAMTSFLPVKSLSLALTIFLFNRSVETELAFQE